MRPNPAIGERKLNDPIYDPIWRTCAELELPIGFHPFLETGHLELLEPGYLLLRERVEGELGERRAAPERERLTKQPRCLERSAPGECRPPSREQSGEAVRIEPSVLDAEDVAG